MYVALGVRKNVLWTKTWKSNLHFWWPNIFEVFVIKIWSDKLLTQKWFFGGNFLMKGRHTSRPNARKSNLLWATTKAEKDLQLFSVSTDLFRFAKLLNRKPLERGKLLQKEEWSLKAETLNDIFVKVWQNWMDCILHKYVACSQTAETPGPLLSFSLLKVRLMNQTFLLVGKVQESNWRPPHKRMQKSWRKRPK